MCFHTPPHKVVPQADFEIADHGSIWTLTPVSVDAQYWAAEHLTDAMRWGNGVVIEPRYVGPIVEGIVNDGLTVMQ